MAHACGAEVQRITWVCAVLLCAIPWNSGASPEGVLKIEVVDPMQRIFFSTPVVERKDIMVELWAARNEYESTQLALHSDVMQAINKVAATDLINIESGDRIPSMAFEYRFPGYVYLRQHTEKTPTTEVEGETPGWFPDPFEVANTLRFRGTRSLWGTWYVPPETKAGDYRGELFIHSETSVYKVPVLLHVWRFTLPKQSSLCTTNWLHVSQIESQYQVKRGTDAFWKIIDKIAGDMSAHRQNVIYTPLNLIHSREQPDGSYTFDFHNYEKWIGIFMRHGFRVIEGSHLFHAKNSYYIQRFFGYKSKVTEFGERQLATRTGQAYLMELLKALYRENIKLGIQDIYLQHIADEASPEKASLYRKIAALVRVAMPGAKIIDATELPEAMREGMMDIPVTLMGKPISKVSSTENAKWGKWWYTARSPTGKFPNRFIDYPLIKMRIIPWLNWRYEMSGYLHYGYNWWYTPSGKSPWLDVDHSGEAPPGDGFVVYPGRNGLPVSSLRWEVFRDGLEDYEYLRLLQHWLSLFPRDNQSSQKVSPDRELLRQRSEALLRDIRTAVLNPESYPRSPQELMRLRLRMGRSLDELAHQLGKD